MAGPIPSRDPIAGTQFVTPNWLHWFNQIANGPIGDAATLQTHPAAYFAIATHLHTGVYEPVLGNPAATNYHLTSTVLGVRSWALNLWERSVGGILTPTTATDSLEAYALTAASATGTITSRGAHAETMRFAQASNVSSAMSGATATITNLIPAKCLLLGVTVHPTTAITSGDGGTTYSLGDGTDVDRFGAAIAFASDVDLGNITMAGPTYYPSTASVVLTCDGAKTFNAGVVRVTAFYLALTAPTS